LHRTGNFEFGLPRFHGAVRSLTLLLVGVWLTILLLTVVQRSDAQLLEAVTVLIPQQALQHGWVWQLFTYPLIHVDPLHIFTVLLALYFIGSAVQERTGHRAFYQLFILSSMIAGLAGSLLSLTGVIGHGSALGAGAAVNAILMVFYLLYRGSSIMLFPFPFSIPVHWVVIAIGAIEGAYFILSGYALFYLVQLLGLGAGYVWYSYIWRRAALGAVFQGKLAISNAYYRWKRRRAAKKFQVYMRKHQQDPKQYFDEYGNFRPPDDDREKKNGGSGPGGWVN